jgi:uncharacterized protein YegJ (DUF2314 family)
LKGHQVTVTINHPLSKVFYNIPLTLKNIKLGDKISIKETDVEDWAVNNLRTKQITGEFSEKYPNSKP